MDTGLGPWGWDPDDLAGQDRAILTEGICEDLLDAANYPATNTPQVPWYTEIMAALGAVE